MGVPNRYSPERTVGCPWSQKVVPPSPLGNSPAELHVPFARFPVYVTSSRSITTNFSRRATHTWRHRVGCVNEWNNFSRNEIPTSNYQNFLLNGKRPWSKIILLQRNETYIGVIFPVLKYNILLNNTCKVKEKNHNGLSRLGYSLKRRVFMWFFFGWTLLVCISSSCSFSSSVDPPFDLGLNTEN